MTGANISEDPKRETGLVDEDAVLARLQVLCKQAYSAGYAEGFQKGFELGIETASADIRVSPQTLDGKIH